jgi:hypothetical protein
MPSAATVPGGFLVCPPLDLPLRLRNEWGNAKFTPLPAPAVGLFPTDHFAAISRSGEPELHQIHEAVDLESGAGNIVYAAYSGEVVSLSTTQVLLSHHVGGSGFATRYIHVEPLPPLAAGDTVAKGQPIATVIDFAAAGPHLHFELWHWINGVAATVTDNLAVPIDPTKMLARWEAVHALDYAVLGDIASAVAPVLDGGAWDGALIHAYRAARLPGFERPEVEVLAPGAVWRISEGDRTHLLRMEEPSITVFDEAYGSRRVAIGPLERAAIVHRRNYPAFVVSGADSSDSYAVPLHDAGPLEEQQLAMLRLAFEQGTPVELDVRRSPYWSMDGSVDDVVATIEGVTLLR